MAEGSIIPKQGVGKTFNAAASILGAIALLQVAAVSLAIVKRGGPAPGAVSGPIVSSGKDAQGRSIGMEESVEPAPATVDGAAGGFLDPEALTAMAVAPETTIQSGTWKPEQPAASELRIDDPKVIELMNAGVSLRERDDLPAALARYREADTLLPNHPVILYEIADCYSAMGLREKAVLEWEKIFDMGMERAGDYWVIADLNLRGESSDESPSDQSVLTIANILVQRHPEVTEGEKVTLRIALKSKTGAEIAPNEVVVNVFFFDQVNGAGVARTTADQPRYHWATLPIDWVDQPQEVLDVEYFHPVLTEEQRRDLGDRKYHGHIVEVFYRDVLQDVVAQPRTLRSLAPEAENPLLQNRLFPTN